MIGYLVLPGRTATMRNGNWHSGDVALERHLRARFPVRDVSPADGEPGGKQLREAAERLGAMLGKDSVFVEVEQESSQPGIIY